MKDLNSELPGYISYVLAYCCHLGRDACWQRRKGSPLSCSAVIKGPDPGVDWLATGSLLSNCSCLLRTRRWFILKQDIGVLRIHPECQPRKLCDQLQHVIHTFYWYYPTNVGVRERDLKCRCFLCMSTCVVKLQPSTLLCCSSFSPWLWHVDVLASCVLGLKLSLYWQGDTDWPVAQQ